MLNVFRCCMLRKTSKRSAISMQHSTSSPLGCCEPRIFLHFPDDNASEKAFGGDKTFSSRVALSVMLFPPFMIIDGKTKAINPMKQFVMSAGSRRSHGEGRRREGEESIILKFCEHQRGNNRRKRKYLKCIKSRFARLKTQKRFFSSRKLSETCSQIRLRDYLCCSARREQSSSAREGGKLCERNSIARATSARSFFSLSVFASSPRTMMKRKFSSSFRISSVR